MICSDAFRCDLCQRLKEPTQVVGFDASSDDKYALNGNEYESASHVCMTCLEAMHDLHEQYQAILSGEDE